MTVGVAVVISKNRRLGMFNRRLGVLIGPYLSYPGRWLM